MKSLKSKVILSAVVLIFALVATIGSTFAWFTVSNTVATSDITLNVVSTDSLLIKLANSSAVIGDYTNHLDPASGYKQTVLIDGTTLTNNGYLNYSTWRLSPATAVQPTYATVSANPANLYILDTDATTNPKRILDTSPSSNNSGGGVVTLKFWLLSQANGNRDLRVSNFSVTGDSLTSPTGNAALENSLRLSFFNPTTSVGYIFGNSLDYDFTFTVDNEDSFYSGTLYSGASPTWTLLGFNKIDDLTHGLASANEPTALSSTILEGSASHGVLEVSDLALMVSGTPQLVTVTLYIEGWDLDANDFLNTIPFTVNFGFTIYPVS